MEGKNAVVIGISKDNPAPLKRVTEKFGLPFVLLSDKELTAIEAYGVLKVNDKLVSSASRSTFVVDENGNVEKIFEKAKTTTNANDVLEYLDGLV